MPIRADFISRKRAPTSGMACSGASADPRYFTHAANSASTRSFCAAVPTVILTHSGIP